MTAEVRWHRSYDAAAMLRELVIDSTGSDPGPLHHRCPVCGSVEHGVPGFDVASLWVSITRAGGLTGVVASTTGPIGIDFEPDGPDALRWVRTEAVGKAHGTGILVDHDPGSAWIEDLVLPAGYVGVIAGLGPRPEVREAARRTTTR